VNPQLIIEVLSESTERYDRGDKWLAYRTIPSLTDYVMISSIRREVEHYQRYPLPRDWNWGWQIHRPEGRFIGPKSEKMCGAMTPT